MCKVRFIKYVNNILNILGRDVFILKGGGGSGIIKFQGEKIRYSGTIVMLGRTKTFDEIKSSPNEISTYTIEETRRMTFTVTAYDTVYLEVNGTVYIDRR